MKNTKRRLLPGDRPTGKLYAGLYGSLGGAVAKALAEAGAKVF